MKSILLIFALLGMLSNQCWAIAPMNLKVIKEAQTYGQTRAMEENNEFLQPWSVYEEAAQRLDETAEKAYLYTPYLLLAADAKQKALDGQLAGNIDSERILGDYAGYIVFSVKLFGDEKKFTDHIAAVLKQGKMQVPTYQLLVPTEAVKNSWYPKKPKYGTECYIYFLERSVDMQAPVTLLVTTGKRDHKFYFDLPRIK